MKLNVKKLEEKVKKVTKLIPKGQQGLIFNKPNTIRSK